MRNIPIIAVSVVVLLLMLYALKTHMKPSQEVLSQTPISDTFQMMEDVQEESDKLNQK